MTEAQRDKLELAVTYESRADWYRHLSRTARSFSARRKYKLQAHHLTAAARSLTEGMEPTPKEPPTTPHPWRDGHDEP